ncbi:hypothetical protein GGR95_002065 [Sulfitobacter undariae]|uniref:Uncharacterized protein n=1 Tax=Sulfitobacter undariae TaxID=1563671 RepID=A0A7W6E499_9RHOB|nr:hypothetical protein [Sulfitobacter undariae]
MIFGMCFALDQGSIAIKSRPENHITPDYSFKRKDVVNRDRQFSTYHKILIFNEFTSAFSESIKQGETFINLSRLFFRHSAQIDTRDREALQ